MLYLFLVSFGLIVVGLLLESESWLAAGFLLSLVWSAWAFVRFAVARFRWARFNLFASPDDAADLFTRRR
jgi:hypothetical protein